MSTSSPVAIVGLGARTPLGLDAPSTAAAVRAAISVIGAHPYFIDKAGEPMSVAMDTAITTDATLVERMAVLAEAALRESLAPLAVTGGLDDPVPVFIGLPEGQPGVPKGLDKTLGDRLDALATLPAPLGPITAFANGHSAGLMALQEAARLIHRGEAALCLAGGIDSYIEAERLEWLDAEEQLMSAENRSGFPPGEAAGFCLVASALAAHRLSLPALGNVVSVATDFEPNRIKTETICVGDGLTKAFRQVIRHLDLPSERIDAMFCDLNGERYRNEEFVFTLLRTQLAFVDAGNFRHPADCWGDVGAASGPLLAVLAVIAGMKGYADGRRCLLWTSSEGGQRGAALLEVAHRD
ncbi:MAG: beta-ketoacyl synthase N-terminal-like domain-containing protein [Pseudomonadota bacterium]|nr:beta-ketoacyl synthase N-terminal-like domain-containing protein [Pseudomonadota bacterium]